MPFYQALLELFLGLLFVLIALFWFGGLLGSFAFGPLRKDLIVQPGLQITACCVAQGGFRHAILHPDTTVMLPHTWLELFLNGVCCLFHLRIWSTICPMEERKRTDGYNFIDFSIFHFHLFLFRG